MQVGKQGPDRRIVISTTWIFVVLNYLYADVLVLLSGHGSATDEEAELVKALSTPDMFLVAAIYLQVAMVMIVLSRVLKYRINRWANIIFASLQAMGAFASLFVVTNAHFYTFFVVSEVIALLFIAWYAWTWKEPQIG